LVVARVPAHPACDLRAGLVFKDFPCLLVAPPDCPADDLKAVAQIVIQPPAIAVGLLRAVAGQLVQREPRQT